MTTQPKPATSRSEEVVRKHKEFLWPAVTNFYQQPLVADHGQMQYLWDLEGRRYQRGFLPRSQSVLLPLPPASHLSRLWRGLRQRRREPDSDRHERLDCRFYRRTHSGRRRIHHSASGILQDCVQDRKKVWRPCHLRRSADRLWPPPPKMVRH